MQGRGWPGDGQVHGLTNWVDSHVTYRTRGTLEQKQIGVGAVQGTTNSVWDMLSLRHPCGDGHELLDIQVRKKGLPLRDRQRGCN